MLLHMLPAWRLQSTKMATCSSGMELPGALSALQDISVWPLESCLPWLESAPSSGLDTMQSCCVVNADCNSCGVRRRRSSNQRLMRGTAVVLQDLQPNKDMCCARLVVSHALTVQDTQ